MVGLITNENALIAQAVLRAANQEVADAQQTISTGLLVSEAADNPAFFLVAQQTTGDQVVVDAIADNLEIAFQASATAEAAIGNVFDSLDRITDAITLADNGIALTELNFAVSQEIDFIRNIIDSTSFNGVNLLSGSETFTPVSGVIRTGGEIQFQTLELRGLNLDDQSLFGQNGVIGQSAGFIGINPGRERALAQGELLVRSFRPEVIESLDLNGDGVFDTTNDSADDSTPGNGVFTFELSREVFEAIPFVLAPFGSNDVNPAFAPLTSFPTAGFIGNLGRVDPEFLAANDRSGDGSLVFLPFPSPFSDDLDSDPTTITFNATQADFDFLSSLPGSAGIVFDGSTITLDSGIGEAFFLAPVDNATGNPQTSVEDVIQSSVLSSEQLVEFAQGSGFSGLLDLLDVSNPLNSTAGALVVVDVLREKANLAASQLGTLAQAIANQQDFLRALSDSLSIGVSALVEADLDEESGRVQAALVRQALAVQGLSVANAQPQSLLQLFSAP